MKKFTQIIIMFATGICCQHAFSQTWCTPPTCTPFPCAGINTYGNTSPVITNVTFNTINRSSTTSQKELYVNTGVATTVVQGQPYNFSVIYSMDPPVCPTYNTSVWIDWNLNSIFDAATEEILQTNASSTGTLSGNITVPSSATLGTTRMRVLMKMDVPCGHTQPDPCLVTDNASVGWHGEVEDYTIVVAAANGITEHDVTNSVDIFPNPMTSSATIKVKNNVLLKNAEFELFDLIGKKTVKVSVADESRSFSLERKNLASGFYFYKLFSEGKTIGAGKLAVE